MGLEKSYIYPDRYYVYAMLCQDGDGPLYVKFGRSCDAEARMMQLRQGIPIPARWFLYVEVAGPRSQSNLEKGLHRRFKARRTRGEWFKFDAYLDSDKAEFRDGCKAEYAMITGGDLRWRRIHVPTLEKKMEERKRAFVHSKTRNRLKAINRRKSNAAEFDHYRKG